MPVQLAQQSFAAGEVAPALYQREDLAKYHIGLRSCLNWYVLATGGASNCQGTGWVGEVLDSSKAGRLVPFEFRSAPAGQTYVLEFGDEKLRFITNGGYVTEATKAISGATKANPCQLTITGHGYSTGDRIYVAAVAGMTQLNGRYFDVTSTGANTVTIAIDSSGYSTYTSGGTAARLYTIATPYAYTDLALLKPVQSADTVTISHPSYNTYKLRRLGNVNWTLTLQAFAPSQPAPSGVTSSAPGSSIFYAITAINDSTGEESLQSADCGSSSRTSTLSWPPLSGCSTYNVYEKKNGVYGLVGIAQASGSSVAWTDTTIDPNTSITPPQQRYPFSTYLATGVSVTAGGSGYGSPSGTLFDGSRAVSGVSFTVSGGVITAGTLATPNQQCGPTAYIQITDGTGSGAVLQPQWTDDGSGTGTSFISGVTVLAGGSGYGTHPGVHSYYSGFVDYGGYVFTPTVSGGAITAVAVSVIGFGGWDAASQATLTIRATDGSGTGAVLAPILSNDVTSNPGTNWYHDGRQWYGGSLSSPQTLWGSVAASFNSMAVSIPTQDDDAITRTLASLKVNQIRHGVSMNSGMIVLTSGAEWKISAGSADVLTPAQFVARPQSYNGCSDIRPIIVNDMILYIRANQKKVRGLQYNWAADTWTGPDFSLLASHLTKFNTIVDWAYATDPDSLVWCVRDDGIALVFTFNNEQQVYAWARRTMTNGAIESVAAVQEGNETAVYFIVRRTIGGVTKRYVERLQTRVFDDIADAWFLDCGLQYSGSPATVIGDLWHLIGEEVYALADGVPVGPFTVSAAATITLTTPASTVTVGKIIPDADLELLDADTSDQAGTTQGRKKKVNHVTLGLENSANQGIYAGPSGGQGAPTLYAMKGKDLVNPLASAPSSAPALITDFMHMVAAPSWDWHGRVLVRVSKSPLPYTITGVDADVSTGS